MKTNIETTKIEALAMFLDCSPDELTLANRDHYGLEVYEFGNKEYAIGDDSEADSAAYANIKDSVWAFNASFLSSYTNLPKEMFKALQDKCEDANEPFLECINRADGGFNGFANEAISCDGRGHFMSSYDGEEAEQSGFYIYRIN